MLAVSRSAHGPSWAGWSKPIRLQTAVMQTLDAEAFRYSLEARPTVISFALADPGDLVRQAHDVGRW